MGYFTQQSSGGGSVNSTSVGVLVLEENKNEIAVVNLKLNVVQAESVGTIYGYPEKSADRTSGGYGYEYVIGQHYLTGYTDRKIYFLKCTSCGKVYDSGNYGPYEVLENIHAYETSCMYCGDGPFILSYYYS